VPSSGQIRTVAGRDLPQLGQVVERVSSTGKMILALLEPQVKPPFLVVVVELVEVRSPLDV
jgi:hypothetical protein